VSLIGLPEGTAALSQQDLTPVSPAAATDMAGAAQDGGCCRTRGLTGETGFPP